MIALLIALVVAYGVRTLMHYDLEERIYLGWQFQEELGSPAKLSFEEFTDHHTRAARPQIWFISGLAGLFAAGIVQYLAERLI